MGFRADAYHNNTNEHQSQVEQEENQEVHPGATKKQKECDYYRGICSMVRILRHQLRKQLPKQNSSALTHTLLCAEASQMVLSSLSFKSFLIKPL